MNDSEGLYDWFDRKSKEDLMSVIRIGCCQQIVSALGNLAGLGIPTASLSAFTERTIEGIARMMGVVRRDRSVEENIGAVFDASVEEGKHSWRSLLHVCRRCHPPTGVEQKTIGILRGHCDACGTAGSGSELASFCIPDVLARLAELERERKGNP